VIEHLPVSNGVPCAVIGIRSIGCTLSAITAAALRIARRPSERITVRPTGHPYRRSLALTTSQLNWVGSQRSKSACFVIVDEGPGRSGSTFLAVAEALEREGVPAESITIVGSRPFDPASLCAEDAESRWTKFRFIATTPSTNSRFKDHVYLGG